MLYIGCWSIFADYRACTAAVPGLHADCEDQQDVCTEPVPLP